MKIITSCKSFLNHFRIRKRKLEEVFTPAKAAEINYVERPSLDRQLLDEMRSPGKQIIVFGHSGSGKTSSVRNLLRKNKHKFIWTHCESSTTVENLILNAFDALDVYMIYDKSSTRSSNYNASLQNEYNSIKATLGLAVKEEKCYTEQRILAPQLTPQKLAKFFGERKLVWLIEDFHKVSESEKVKIADILKIFVDNAIDYPESKIICVGACQSAYELIRLDPNLKTRVSEIHVPLLNDEEIKSIVINGFSLLNIIPSKSLVEKLVFYSDRLGSFAHQMCEDICSKNGVTATKFYKMNMNDESFQYAVDGFIERRTDTLKSIYYSAIKDKLGWYILKEFSQNEKSKISYDELCKKLNKFREKYSADTVLDKLNELMSPSINIIYYNQKIEKYSISTPFWHRFLRMQFSVEKSERIKNRRARNNSNLQLVSGDDRYYIVDKLMLDLLIKMKDNNLEWEN